MRMKKPFQGPCEEDKESPVKGEIWMKLFQQLFTLYFCSWHFSQLKANVWSLWENSVGEKEERITHRKQGRIYGRAQKPALMYLPQCSLMGYKTMTF